QEQSVHLDKNGLLPVAIESNDDFDAADVDVSTIQIDGVHAVSATLSTKHKNGHRDLICHFDVPGLVAAGALASTTTEVTVKANLADGSCVEGTSEINVH